MDQAARKLLSRKAISKERPTTLPHAFGWFSTFARTSCGVYFSAAPIAQ